MCDVGGVFGCEWVRWTCEYGRGLCLVSNAIDPCRHARCRWKDVLLKRESLPSFNCVVTVCVVWMSAKILPAIAKYGLQSAPGILFSIRKDWSYLGMNQSLSYSHFRTHSPAQRHGIPPSDCRWTMRDVWAPTMRSCIFWKTEKVRGKGAREWAWVKRDGKRVRGEGGKAWETPFVWVNGGGEEKHKFWHSLHPATKEPSKDVRGHHISVSDKRQKHIFGKDRAVYLWRISFPSKTFLFVLRSRRDVWMWQLLPLFVVKQK